jgi:hypothetical protein
MMNSVSFDQCDFLIVVIKQCRLGLNFDKENKEYLTNDA